MPILIPRFVTMAALVAVASGCASAANPSNTVAAADTAALADTSSAGSDATATGDAALDTATGADATASGPTWHTTIAPIVRAKCGGCHTKGGIAPFAIDSYAEAKTTAALWLDPIADQEMPPWGARETPECKPRFGWKHDLRLQPAEVDAIAAWLKAGMPEGQPQAGQTGAGEKLMELADVDLVAKPAKPFVSAGEQDQLQCFVLDADFAEDKFLNGVQVHPGNPTVVHHALLFLDPEAQSVKKANADGTYPCFGSADVDGQNLLAAWAPGAVPLEYPVGAGSKIPKGSKLVMQIHYHPAGQTAAPDLTKVQMRFVKGAPTLRGETVLVGNFDGFDGTNGLLPGPDDPASGPAFVIPAGKASHTEEMVFTLPPSLNGKAMPELKIYAVGTHMHYVGKGMRIAVERATQTQPCGSSELTPLGKCLSEKCPGLNGLALANCAQTTCASAAGSISASCGECLKTEVLKGAAADAILLTCTTATPKTLVGPEKECLVETPQWDFDWQRIYVYDAPIDQLPTLSAGDRLRMRCTYDNSMGNPAVVSALKAQGKAQPQDVWLGEQTLDEMCLAVVQILYKPAN